MTQKKIFEIGGYIAAAILIAFGLGSIGMSINGRNEARADVKREYIVGSQDMNKTAILAEAKQANLPAEVMDQIPTCNVAGKTINSGARAKCFAAYMRIHTFESTGGKTYSQMGRYLTKERQGHKRPDPRRGRSEDTAAGRERGPEPLGDGDRADERAEHLVLRGAGRTVRDRRRVCIPPRRDRVRDPRLHGLPLAPGPRAQGRQGTGGGSPARLVRTPCLPRRAGSAGPPCFSAPLFRRRPDAGDPPQFAHWFRDRRSPGRAEHRGQPPAAPLGDLAAPTARRPPRKWHSRSGSSEATSWPNTGWSSATSASSSRSRSATGASASRSST